MSKTKSFSVFLALSFLFIVSLAACLARTMLPSQPAVYDYFDISSLPSHPQLHPGENATVYWKASRDVTDEKKEAILLSVLLISPQSFRTVPCGAIPSPTLLDQFATNNTSGLSYKRPFRLPPQMKAGQYELVRKVTLLHSRVSECAGLLVTIS